MNVPDTPEGVKSLSTHQVVRAFCQLQIPYHLLVQELYSRVQALDLAEQQCDELRQVVVQQVELIQQPIEGEPITAEWAIARDAARQHVEVLLGRS